MMRFIHAADPHIDSPLKGLRADDGAPVEVIGGATRRAFENLINLAIIEKVDFLVIAGDLYDGDWKSYDTGLFFRRQMARLCDKGIPVYLIKGNHDAASVISRRLSLPANVHVFSTRIAESMDVAEHRVVIHGRGFTEREERENLVLDYPRAVPYKFNIGLLHTSLSGRPGHDTYAPCSETDLRQKGYDYWALGHIHKPEIISRDPWIVFSGNCQGRDAGELGQRGCFLVTVNDSLNVQNVEWRSLDVVRWHLLEIDLTGVKEESEALSRVSRSMADAVSKSAGLLVAARVVFRGASLLHGSLHRETNRWRAELLGRAQDQGEGAIWIEEIKILTSPVYNLSELADRDALTGIVLETLDQAMAEPQNLPADIAEMLDILPPEIRSKVESEMAEIERTTLMQDVRAIILDALGTKGSEAS